MMSATNFLAREIAAKKKLVDTAIQGSLNAICCGALKSPNTIPVVPEMYNPPSGRSDVLC